MTNFNNRHQAKVAVVFYSDFFVPIVKSCAILFLAFIRKRHYNVACMTISTSVGDCIKLKI